MRPARTIGFSIVLSVFHFEKSLRLKASSERSFTILQDILQADGVLASEG